MTCRYSFLPLLFSSLGFSFGILRGLLFTLILLEALARIHSLISLHLHSYFSRWRWLIYPMVISSISCSPWSFLKDSRFISTFFISIS
jgi:hypothetical protein